MAGNTVIVRVLGNTKSLSSSLRKARADLGNLGRINSTISNSFRTAAVSAAVFGAAAVASGVAGTASLAGVPVVLGAIGLAAGAAGAGITLALGGALLGIGVAAAAQNKAVKESFSNLKKDVGKSLVEMAKPLVPVLQKTATALGGAFDNIAPALEKTFKAAVPVVQGFNKALAPISKNLAPAIVNVFKAATPVFAALTASLVTISDGFKGFARELALGGPAFADFTTALLGGFGNMLPAFGRFLAAATPVGTAVANTIMPALTSMFDILSKKIGPLFDKTTPVLSAFGEAISSIGGGVSEAFGILLASSGDFSTFITTLGEGIATLLPVAAQIITALTPIGTTLLTVLVPALATLGTTIASNVGPAFSTLTGVISAHPTLFQNLAIGVLLVVAGFKAAALVAAVYNGALVLAGIATGTFSGILTVAAAAQRIFTAASIGTRIGLAALAIQMAVVKVATATYTAAQWLLNAALTANPIGIVVVAIAALVAALVIAYKKSETFRNIVNGAWNAVRSASVAVFGFLAGFISGAWNRISSAVTSGVSAARNAVSSGWNAVRSITSSVWNSIKSVVTSAINGVRSAVSSGASAARSAISSAWNAARSATTSAWNSIKSAVTSAVGAVMSIISGLPGRILGALSGMGSLLYSTGINLIQGMINGVQAMAGNIASAARSVVSGAISAARGALGINSPSKVFHLIGKQTGQGLVNGLQYSRKRVYTAAFRMARAVTRGGRKAARHWSRKGLTRALKETQRQIKRTQKGLAGLQKKAKDYSAEIRKGALSYGSVTNLNTAFTSTAMAQQLKARIQKIREFNDVLATLAKRGLNKKAIDDLAKAGVEGGLATAIALKEGGKGAVNQFNRLQRQLQRSSGALGKTTSDSMYRAGIAASQGLVKGLRAKRKVLLKVARRMGNVLTKGLKKQLGIKSPSRVFARLGEQTVQGLEVGLKNSRGVDRAVANIGKSMVKSFDRPTLRADAGMTGSGSTTVQITVNVPATANPAEVGREVAASLDAYYKQGGRRLAV